MRYTGEAIDPPSELDCDGIGNYGTDTDTEGVGYLLNRDGACDYGEVIGPRGIEVYKVLGWGNLIRKHHGKKERTSNQFRDNTPGGEPKMVSRK